MIYEESGCEPASFVGSAPLGCERVTVTAAQYYPRFDGLTQYALLSEVLVIPAGVDFEIEVVASGLAVDWSQSLFSGPTIDNFYRTLIGGAGVQVYAGVYAGAYAVTWSTAGFDVQPSHSYLLRRVGTVLSIVIDGDVKANKNNSVGQVVVDRLMRSWNTSAHTSGVLYSLKLWLTGSLTSAIEFNQRNQAVQVASVGSVNAEIINHTEAMWEQI